MKKLYFFIFIFCISSISFGQTYFVINQISIEPENPTTDDSINILLIGSLSEMGAYIEEVEVFIQDNDVFLTIHANSTGGFQMLIDYTESIELAPLFSGDYQIHIEGDFILDNVSDPLEYYFTVEDATGLHEQIAQNIFEIFPNPASDYININCQNCDAFSFKIINSNGVELLKSSQMNKINITELKFGLYFLVLYSGEKQFIHSFVKQ